MKNLLGIIVFALCVMAAFALGRCQKPDTVWRSDTVIVRDTTRDTVTLWRTDTVPEFVSQITVDTIWLPSEDSVRIPVVQREYSDDSTYRAYVSGLEYGVWPRLDSISVSQRTVTERIRERVTITKRKRWSLGVQGGMGFGVVSRRIEPYVGFGVSYDISP